MLKLIGTDGNRYYSWELNAGKFIVGRKPECDFCVPDGTVSRQHAELEMASDGERCFLTDLGSHNGTLVNGERISSPTLLQQGDRIMFGHTEFRLASADEVVGSPSGPTHTRLAERDPEKSVFLSINEALKPLPTKVTDRPELLPTLFDMAKMLVLHESQDVILNRALEMIAKVIPSDRLAVLFVSEDGEDIYTAASLLPGGKDPGAFRLSRTIVNEMMNEKNAILIGDPQADPRFAEQKSIIMSDLKSAVAVPLFDEGKVLGILYADTTDPRHRYDDDHLRILATFGNIIAAKLLSYQLIAERQQKQILDAELRRAAKIQKGLLVETLPQVSGYEICAFQEQSRSVGGDLYDTAVLPDGRLLFLVADVSGKGIGAALLMSNILASFRVLYEAGQFDLCRAVERVSLLLCRFSGSRDFATLFIGLLDPETHRLNFVNAGHNPPLLVRSDGKMDFLDSSGVMIGAFDFASWTEETREILPGDLLFVFTDGVTEAEREDDEQYGDERTESLVVEARGKSPQQVVDHLMADLNDFMGQAPRSDDITMLLIKRAGV